MTVMDDIRSYIVETYLPERAGTLSADAPLFIAGVLDSIHLVSLVIYLQDHFNIHIHPLEITPKNFNNLQSITDLVEQKRVRPA